MAMGSESRMNVSGTRGAGTKNRWFDDRLQALTFRDENRKRITGVSSAACQVVNA